MAFDITIFTGLDELSLLKIRNSALANVLSGSIGQAISSITTRDLSVSYGTYGVSVMTNEQVLSAVNWALQNLNPDLYGNSLIRMPRKMVV